MILGNSRHDSLSALSRYIRADFCLLGSNRDRDCILRPIEHNDEFDSLISLDQQLQKIRRSQEEKYGTAELDFYSPPLVSQWKKPSFAAQTKDVRREHVLAALQEIDQGGIPPDAASTTYDLIHEHRRYPPKLVLSLATKHASGEEYDRALFSGGEQSQAFAFLRSLKFHIERKDFVETLVGKFLGQAGTPPRAW